MERLPMISLPGPAGLPMLFAPRMLNTQYRMHPALAEFPSKEFYGGKVASRVSAEDMVLKSITKVEWPNPTAPRIFWNIERSREQRARNGRSLMNVPEMAFIAIVLDRLYSRGADSGQIGVITFYAGEVGLALEALPKMCKAPKAWVERIEVNTVDAFEGRDVDIVIVVCVRANNQSGKARVGFLTDPGRMNVALTRAKFELYIIGHAPTLSGDPVWKRFIDYCRDTETLVNIA